MDLASVLLFAAAIAVGTSTPGPTVVTLVARVLTLGRRANLPFAAGLIVGDVIWLACAVFGLAALAAQAHEVMVVLKWLGVCYLVYLAYRLWTAPVQAVEPDLATARRRQVGSAFGGLAVAIANPKTMMFYLALIPNLLDMSEVDGVTFLQLTCVLVVVYGAVQALYMAGAIRARRVLGSPAARRAVNRGSAVVLTGTAAVVAART